MKFVKPLTLFKESLKTEGPIRRRLIGLNVGDKYLGIAMSNITNAFAIPLGYFHLGKNNLGITVNDLQALVTKLNLLGLILGKDKHDGPLCNNFTDELHKSGKFEGLLYTYWDKNISSETAGRKAIEIYPDLSGHFYEYRNVPPIANSNIVTLIMLQGYLDCANSLEIIEREDSKANSLVAIDEENSKRKLVDKDNARS